MLKPVKKPKQGSQGAETSGAYERVTATDVTSARLRVFCDWITIIRRLPSAAAAAAACFHRGGGAIGKSTLGLASSVISFDSVVVCVTRRVVHSAPSSCYYLLAADVWTAGDAAELKIAERTNPQWQFMVDQLCGASSAT
jgi:hypothetical protein